MAHYLPPFWPEAPGDTLKIALALHGDRRLTVVKELQDSVLTDYQRQALVDMGFMPGQEGRWIAPFEPSAETLERLGKVLVAPMVVFNDNHLVTLKAPSENPATLIPRELRDAMGWWWRNARRDLAREIEISVMRGMPENESAMLENRVADSRNPDRVRMWLAQALAGEINEFTEPVFGLALSRLEKLYGGDLPEDIQEWKTACAEFRGDVPEITKHYSDHELSNRTNDDARPAVGERVKYWEEEFNRESFGRVLGKSENDSEAFFVMPDNPEYLTGMAFPLKRKVMLSELRGEHQERLEDIEQRLTPPQRDPDVDNPADETLWTAAEISVDDLPNPDIREANSDGGLLSQRGIERLRYRLLCRTMTGRNPLLAGASNMDIEHVIASGVTRSDPELQGSDEEAMSRRAEAAGIIRDEILRRFNDAQPAIPDAHAPVLAVIPLATSESNSLANPSPEAIEEAESLVGYGIGFHPKFIWRLKDRIQELQKTYENEPAFNAEPRLKAFFAEEIEALIHGAPHEFLSMSSLVPARWTADGVRFSKEYIFNTADEAKDALQERFFRGQGIDRTAIDNNEKALSLIAKLSDQSPKAIESIHHPLFWLLDQAESQGDLPRWNRATALAALNIDLSTHTRLFGELAMASGVSTVHALSSVVKDRFPETLETTGKESHRAHVHTIVLKGGNKKHLLSLGVFSEHETRDDRADFYQGLSGTHRRTFAREDDKTAYADDPNSMRRLNAQWDDAPASLHRKEASSLTRWLQMMLVNGALKVTLFPASEPVTNKLCDDMQVNWLAAENLANLAFLDIRYDAPGKFLQPLENTPTLEKLPSFYSRDEANSILMDIEKAVQNNAASLIHTLSGEWLGSNDYRDRILKGIQIWLLEQPHFQKLGVTSVERIAGELTEDFLRCPSPEGVVVATRASSRNIFRRTRLVTSDDIAKAGFDRKEAMEMALMKAKSSHRSTRGVRGAIFDAMAILSPEQKEELARMQDAQDKASRDAMNARDKTEESPEANDGRRVNTGLVYGLSVKDLRGSSQDVIKSIEKSTLESQEKLIRKTKLWPAPDWVSLRSPEDGTTAMEPAVAYVWDRIRKNMTAQPTANTATGNKLYARLALLFRDEMPKHRTLDELKQNGIPKLVEALSALDSEAKDAGFRPHKLFGDEIGGGAADYYIARRYVSEGLNRTDDNKRWPAHLGKARRQAMAADQDGPKTGAMPMLKRLVREGEDYRLGRDITEDELVQEFGFSGVEYGESMSQKERTIYLNQAYDGFMDLARTMKVDPQALSLGGTLGLAFGSRGRGGRRAALAHFEPTNNVINLTREKGAGSMAHEFGHGLANYFFRQTKGVRRGEGDIMATLSAAAVHGKGAPADVDLVATGGVRREVVEALDKIRTTINVDPETGMQTEFLSSASAVDYEEGRGTPEKRYWSSPEELFARTFETWVSHRLKSLDTSYRNDFLVRNDKLDVWGEKAAAFNAEKPRKEMPQLYPTGQHLERLDQAFRELFATIKTQPRSIHHEHLGEVELPHMYSFDGSIERLSPKEMGPLAFCAIREIARMCGDDVGVRFRSEILTPDGNARAAGRFSLLDGEDPSRPGYSLKGLIEFSHHMNLSAIYHEGFHYAQHCLFTSGEQAMLQEAFAPGSPMFERLVGTLQAQGKQHLIEHLDNPVEVQAYAFQEWVAGRLSFDVEEQPTTYFGEIKRLGQRIVSTTQEVGFRNPEALFRAFYAGDLQRRAEVSNLQAAATSLSKEKCTESVKEDNLNHTDNEARNGQTLGV